MPRKDRAKQFAPFDALRGLREAISLEEYKHERCQKGGVSQEKIDEISKTLGDLKKGDVVEVRYFIDGYYKNIKGKVNVDIIKQSLSVDKTVISFEDLFDIKICS